MTDQPHYTSAQGRRFGLTVGTAFLVLSALAWWRDQRIVMIVLGAPGLLLVAAAVTIAPYLGPVEKAWMRLAHLISRVTTPIVMAVMYLGVLLPVGILRRRLGGNPLVHVEHGQSFWRERPAGSRRSASMRRQF